jgi:capsular polysaccharide biosynthesis protein
VDNSYKFNHDESVFLNPLISNRNLIFTNSYLSIFDSNKKEYSCNSYLKYHLFPKLKSILNLNIKFYLKRCSVCSDEYTYNYFHCVLDVLPRIIHLRNKNQLHFLLLPAHLLDSGYVSESLKMLNISNFQFLNKKKHCFIVSANYFKQYIFTGNYYPDLLIQFRSLLSSSTSQKIFPYIYISRDNAGSRNVINERELQRILTKFGFTTIYAEKLSLYQQINIFKNCKILISPHGAGLTNMIHMKEGAMVLEFRIKHNQNNCYYRLSNALKLPYSFIECEAIHNDQQDYGFFVDLNKLESILFKFEVKTAY